ncbi:hypothetical protein SAMN05216533_1710 [Streptomyces sp. Ag109_O5-10]|nr:hypothetical protein SAMN05216533_1710 [Streptomyces sp. Ag109_O5-10]
MNCSRDEEANPRPVTLLTLPCLVWQPGESHGQTGCDDNGGGRRGRQVALVGEIGGRGHLRHLPTAPTQQDIYGTRTETDLTESY